MDNVDSQIDEVSHEKAYKKDTFLLKVIIGFCSFTGLFLVLLFIVGFVMGANGLRPPVFDGDIISSKLSEVTGSGQQDNTGYNELDKNTYRERQ